MISSCPWKSAFVSAVVFFSLLLPTAAATADEEEVALIERCVRDWQPTQDERLLDQVGWASDLVEAQRLAQKHQRPLLVLTYNGSTVRANAMALQRC